MSNFQTIKNSLKKLETIQEKTVKNPMCGVIYRDEYEKMTFPVKNVGYGSKVGYLVVTRRLTIAEWVVQNE